MKSFILSQKIVPDLVAFDKKLRLLFNNFDGLNQNSTSIEVLFKTEIDQDIIDQIEAIIPPQANAIDTIKIVVAKATAFGQGLMAEFAAENVLMGITAEGMTGTVRKNMSQVISALQTGSLYDAITETKAIPANQKDSKYITDARLLQFVNKIEVYLGIPLSTNL